MHYMLSINWAPVALALIPVAASLYAIWLESREDARKERKTETPRKG